MSKPIFQSEKNHVCLINAKKAFRLICYDSFYKIAKKLKSKGLLSEENYRRVKDRSIAIHSGTSILCIVIGIGLIFYDASFICFMIFFICAILTIFFQQKMLDRYCYLYTFGKKVDGELLMISKKRVHQSFVYTYDIVFEFIDSQGNVLKAFQRNLYFNPKIEKTYKVGDKILVCYDPNNPKDAVLLIQSYNFYNLSLSVKN